MAFLQEKASRYKRPRAVWLQDVKFIQECRGAGGGRNSVQWTHTTLQCDANSLRHNCEVSFYCVYLSKHIESCLKMVLPLRINDTARRNVELNQRQLPPGAPASSGCSLFYTAYLTRSLQDRAGKVLWHVLQAQQRQPKRLYKVALSVANLQSRTVLFYKASFPGKFTSSFDIFHVLLS